MIRTGLIIITVAIPFVFTGCAGGRRQHEGENQALTGDAAKRALLDMDVRQIPPGVLVPPPKDEPIEVVNPDEISFGRYHCNLKEKTFHASTFYPNADRHKFNDVRGVFEFNADGKWVAKVTESMSGH